jgi:hypothetical protein
MEGENIFDFSSILIHITAAQRLERHFFDLVTACSACLTFAMRSVCVCVFVCVCVCMSEHFNDCIWAFCMLCHSHSTSYTSIY